ncbi:ATP-dependent helicase HrpB [Shewanella waksmanii]|uniref:ATP-dependent helicase HrpB n=1 Tax=Shewanella waksmanii TaxID=213783 RepID=UPI00048FE233|nr:ATP-dependent helicase HrpB [Shewanella waksmanii]
MNHIPIFSLFEPIRQALSSHQQLIIEAPTGAGKSTALPLAMLDWPEIDGKILMLEPRRVAARSVAQFIAKQRGCRLGDEVGFRVRGETKVSQNTRLEVVTEGVLTRMIQQDPELTGIAAVIFDEIHERHLTTDLGLALALEVQASLREDLTLIAMSATLTGLPLQSLMPDAAQLRSEGRSFPVDVQYRAAKATDDWLNHMGAVISELCSNGIDGSLLAFLPGQREIMQLQRYLSARIDDAQFVITPLYGALTAKQQDLAIAPAIDGCNKIVLATNVAESSLTIEGITYVVDSGYKRQASFNPKTGVTRLSMKRISQSSAAQRSGRAGRIAPGVCIRLWSKEQHDRLLSSDEPEISHNDLTSMCLDAALWGVNQLSALPLLTAAAPANEQIAWQLLQQLELTDNQHKITAHGQAAYQLGCEPRLAHMLLKAKLLADAQQQPMLVGLAALLVGVIESRSRSRKGADIQGYLAEALRGEAGQRVRQWLRHFNLNCSDAELLNAANSRDVAMLLAFAYPDRIAKKRGQGFQLACGSGVSINEQDPLANQPWLVVADFQETQGQASGRVYLAAELDNELFDGPLASLVNEQQICGWDDTKQKFDAQWRRSVGEITLSCRPSKLDAQLIAPALCALVVERGLTWLQLNDKTQQLMMRAQLMQQWHPQWPAYDEPSLLAEVSDWLQPYLTDISRLPQLLKLDFYTLLLNRLTWEQQQLLSQWLPTHWPMATGTRSPIRYDDAGRALLSVRLQEALGMAQSPQLANGNLVATMELLSPAQRPIALTADLSAFWQGAYVEVKKEMKGRYPKHLWPDDPANTNPTKYTKKKTLNRAQ